MKKNTPFLKRAALVAVLLAASSGWLVAQDTPPAPTQAQNQVPGQPDAQNPLDKRPGDTSYSTQSASLPMKINKASSLIGTTVKNQKGEDVGKIRDVVINFSSDRVAYCVLGVSSGLLKPEKLHAVPLRALQPSSDGMSLTLNVDKDKFERSEGFNKSNWPDMGNPAWGAEIQQLQPPTNPSINNTLELNRRIQDQDKDRQNNNPQPDQPLNNTKQINPQNNTQP